MAAKLRVNLEVQGKNVKVLDEARAKVKKLDKVFGALKKSFLSLQGAIAAGAVVAIGKGFVDAAAKIEIFSNQLLMVTSSAEQADTALKAIREFARTSPLETEDVVQSYVRLRAVGIDPTMEQMKTLGGVAVLFNREMTDVLNGFIGLNKRTLREIGIDIDRTGKKAIIASGDVRREVDKDTNSIRKALISIWEERFPNAIDKASDTTKSQLAIMKSEFFELRAVIGEKLLPTVNKLAKKLSDLSAGLKDLITKDSENAGKLANERIEEVNKVLKLIKEQKDIVETQTSFSKQGGSLFSQEKLDEAKQAVEVYKEILKELNNEIQKSDQGLKGSGNLGTGAQKTPGGDGAGDKAAKKSQALHKKLRDMNSRWLDELVDKQMEAEEKIRENAEKQNEQILESRRRLAEARLLLITDGDQRELAALDLKHTAELEAVKGNQEAITNLIASHKIEREALEKEHNERLVASQEATSKRIFDSAFQLGSSLMALGRQGVENSKMNAKKKKGILRAMAIAEGAATIVSAVKQVWSDGRGNTYTDIAESILVGASIAAGTAAQLNAINNASFQRGTLNAPGGIAEVGEDGPEYVRLPSGSQVFTAGETQRMRQNITNDNSVSGVTLNISDQVTGERLLKALRNGELRDFVVDMKQALVTA